MYVHGVLSCVVCVFLASQLLEELLTPGIGVGAVLRPHVEAEDQIRVLEEQLCCSCQASL